MTPGTAVFGAAALRYAKVSPSRGSDARERSPVAQLAELPTVNRAVDGSSPSGGASMAALLRVDKIKTVVWRSARYSAPPTAAGVHVVGCDR